MANTTFSQHATVQQDGQGNPFLTYTSSTAGVLFQINSLGNISAQGGITAVGFGSPLLISTYSASLGFGLFLTSGAAAINIAPSTTPAGTYRLSAYTVIATTFSGNSVATVPITVGWTDSTHTQTNATLLPGTTLTANTAQQGQIVINNAGTAAITITPSATTGNPTAGAMSVYISLERLI